jgi:hypothetical protein
MGRDLQHHATARRTARIRVAGRAIVHGDHGVTSCDLVDLSLGGMLLQCDGGGGGQLPAAGDPVSVELHLATRAGRWYDLSAHVVRRAAADRLVLSVDRLPLDLEDDIEDELLAAVEAARAPRVVVVDHPGERRDHISAAVRRADCEPIVASTPLEAIERVEECRTHATAVIVGEALTQTHGGELAHYFHVAHPEVRVAVIRDPTEPPTEPPAEPLDDGVVVLTPDDCDHTSRVRAMLAPLG